MSGWERLGGPRSKTRFGRDSAMNERIPSSRAIRLGRVTPQAPGHRTIYCNDREANQPVRFKGNSISTTKYNIFTFLPKGLFEQFRRVANLYFLTISILSATKISPVSPITNVVPLSLVLLVSLVKEAFEDWKRFQNDMAINNNPIDILQDQKWEPIPWKKLQVGDIVRVKQDGFFPADLLFLASTNPDGVCYIETANLDGETNLKIRKALEKTWDYLAPEKAHEFKGEVQCEQPNNSLYTFTGNLIVQKQTLPLTPNQLLLRGCSLRNTEYIVGVVIFSGHETKVMMNAMNVPSKRSTFERKLDKLILMLFGVLFTMCLIGAIGSGVFINRKYYYLSLTKSVDDQFNPDNRFLVALLTMFTLITLYSSIIPISLYVSIEMVKFIQCTQFINKDLHMYHSETNTPALARTSNLNEELGQVNKMLKPEKWQATFDSDGKIFGFQKALKMIVLGGVDPSIRPEVWEFLLGCYKLGSTAEYRTQLRTARRERYKDLIRECQMMHSSIGTGSLAYVVGSKVMDMRTSSKDDRRREAKVESTKASIDNANLVSRCDWNYNFTDMSYACQRESSSNSADLVSVRGSTDSGAYDSSCYITTSGPCNCSSPKIGREADGSQCAPEDYFVFPPLPVTDLFDKSGENKRSCELHDDKLPTQLKPRFDDDGMHSFQITNNEDLIIELNGSQSTNVSHPIDSGIEMVCPDAHESILLSHTMLYETEIVNQLRISDVPQTAVVSSITSQGGAASKDRVSEWLWTLHRIVVDVVRTDSHLEFYEDTRNLARMSDILAVYAWVDPATGYCQGMSDLLSPFVVLFEDNGDAFWCFEMLLRRMRENFQMEGPTGVMKQLQALWQIVGLTDREMFAHLSHIGAESLHFAFRMLLVLFRRELSFNEALSMWEMIWAADFDESVAYDLEENCLEALVLQLPRDSGLEVRGESTENGNGTVKGGGIQSNHGNAERLKPHHVGVKSISSRPFCGLTRNFWSKNDRFQICTVVSSTRNGHNDLPVYCVAAILIMNRQKIIRETHSFDDVIKIFNDNMLKINVKRCIRTAIKLRKKYLYKLIRIKSPAAHDED